MGHFRAIKGAVPLKRTAIEPGSNREVDFRAIKGAVPLKRSSVMGAFLLRESSLVFPQPVNMTRDIDPSSAAALLCSGSGAMQFHWCGSTPGGPGYGAQASGLWNSEIRAMELRRSVSGGGHWVVEPRAPGYHARTAGMLCPDCRVGEPRRPGGGTARVGLHTRTAAQTKNPTARMAAG